MIDFLDWDSSFFGLKIGKCHLVYPSLTNCENLFEEKKGKHYDLVYVFIDKENEKVNDWLLSHGAQLVDHKIIYEKSVSDLVHIDKTITDYQDVCSDNLINLALASGHTSRFKLDSRLNHKFNELYSIWIQKSIDKTLADKTFTYQVEEKIYGFVTIKIKNEIGQIGLIAVDEQMRGKGIGKSLVAQCDLWLAKNSIKKHQVITQQKNTSACALYESCGFKIKDIQTIFHF